MRRWNKFLALPMLLLIPISGAIAMTINHRDDMLWYFSEADGIGACVSAKIPFRCGEGSTGCVGLTGPEANKQLYLTAVCDQPLGYYK